MADLNRILDLSLLFALTFSAAPPAYSEPIDSPGVLHDHTVALPVISEQDSPFEEIRVSDTAYAPMRKPPGVEGPFPTAVLLHGGVSQFSPQQLRRSLSNLTAKGVTPALLLAKGYAIVYATRRDLAAEGGRAGQVQDSLQLMAAVRKRPDVDAESLVVFGGSGGGPPALAIASSNLAKAVALGEPGWIQWAITDDSGSDISGVHDEIEEVLADLPTGAAEGARDRASLVAQSDLPWTPELEQIVRRKMDALEPPIFLLVGTRNGSQRAYIRNFVERMAALDQPVEMKLYPGEWHSFYWGGGTNSPRTPFQVADDLDSFFRHYITTQPKPVAAKFIKLAPVDMSKSRQARIDSLVAADLDHDGKTTWRELGLARRRRQAADARK